MTLHGTSSKFVGICCNRNTGEKGFTLLELILYIGTLVIMMSALIPFAWNVIEGGAKNSVEREVYSQGRYVSERIKYEIRNAAGINAVSPTQISLATTNPATNPTIIASNSGSITIQQGTGNPIALNSQNTTVQSLVFTNYSSSDNKTQNIQFIFTIAAKYSGAGKRQEYQSETTLEGSAEVRGYSGLNLYTFKKQITIHKAQVSGGSDLGNFPVLISFTDPNLIAKSQPGNTCGTGNGCVQSDNGYDIIFTDDNQTTKLDHEVENYNKATGEIEMWVRLPVLSASADTILYMYYDNGSITSSQENVAGVWDSSYKGVWHLKETGTTSYDSTANGANAAWTNINPTSGKIAGAQSYNGTSSYEKVTSATVNIANTSDKSIEVWVKPVNFLETGANYGPRLLSNIINSSTNAYQLTIWADGNGFAFSQWDSGTEYNIYAGNYSTCTNVFPANQWYLVVGTYTASTHTPLLYVNGVQMPKIGCEPGETWGVGPATTGLYFGTLNTEGAGWLNGALDEAKISNVARSPGWIITEYNNQSSPATFYTVSSAISQ